jgi:flagellar biosynthesis anti-sigma factor FlgM
MVDPVSFGPARPVPGPRAQPARHETQQRVVSVNQSGPQPLSLAAALTHLGPPYDAEKVASLKAAIASGSFQINLGDIADGIIRFGGSDLG